MAITPNQLRPQIRGAIQVLGNISAKERGEEPNKEFAENYNNLLVLAKEAMPNVDARRWPPAVQTHTPAMGQAPSTARYVEIHVYLQQIMAILAEGAQPQQHVTWGGPLA